MHFSMLRFHFVQLIARFQQFVFVAIVDSLLVMCVSYKKRENNLVIQHALKDSVVALVWNVPIFKFFL